MPRAEQQARLGKEETIWAAAGVLRGWIEKYGVPRALYTDWKNVYKRKATPAEQLRGKVPVTQFGRMCQKLGIRIIAASSPQAKGRVERIHGVHQDRLIKKLRRQGIDQLRSREPVSGKAVSGGAQPSFARAAAEAGRLSRPEADQPGELRADLPLGDRTGDWQRLGDSSSWPLSATATWAADAMDRHKARLWCANGRTEHARCTTEARGILFRTEGANTTNRSAWSGGQGRGGEETLSQTIRGGKVIKT